MSNCEEVILANDATVKGGAFFSNDREEALARTGDCAPHSGGANLPHEAEIFADR